jgi:hypothetical protein
MYNPHQSPDDGPSDVVSGKIKTFISLNVTHPFLLVVMLKVINLHILIWRE